MAQYGMRLRVNGSDIFVLYPTYMTCAKELSMYGNKISNTANPTDAQDVATKNYVDTHLPTGLGLVTSPINMNGNEITGLPTSITDLTSDSSSISKKVFIDVMSDALALKLNKSGGTMSGNLIMGGYFINNIHDPMLPNDAVTLGYLGNNYVKKVGDTMGGDLNMGSSFCY